MNIVEIRDFCFAYPDCSSKVLDQVNLSIQEGTLNVICVLIMKIVFVCNKILNGKVLYIEGKFNPSWW